MCGIYCIENIVNNKRYIGQSVDIEQRWDRHKRSLNGGYHHNSHLQRAWDFYGEDNFKFYVLDECEHDKLNELESYYITLYDSMNEAFGYNLESGGSAKKYVSDITRKRMSESAKGKRLSQETRLKISKSVTGHKPGTFTQESLKRISDFNKGKIIPEKTRHKISETLKGIKRSEETLKKRKENNPMNVAVYCIELDIVFNTISDAAKHTNTQRSNIQKCLKGERKTAGRHPETDERLHWEKVEK